MYYIGIIYNWKGLKEENFLYTLEELKEYDKELCEACVDNPTQWHESANAPCAWKTWCGKLLETDNDVRDFLMGKYNDDINNGDWYWANQLHNGLYGASSKTMSKAVTEHMIPMELCQ